MRRTPPTTTPTTILALFCGGLTLAGCGDSRLHPAGLRQADKSAFENLPPGSSPGIGPRPRVRPRPSPRPRPQPVTGATIPTPPYRLDVRVDPTDLALIPSSAALTAAIRPDLPAGFARLLGPHGRALHRLPALQWLGQQLLTKSFATPLGLRTDRAILVALVADAKSFEPLSKSLGAQMQRGRKPGMGPQISAALKPDRLAETTVRIRIVARVTDAQQTRVGLHGLANRTRNMGRFALQLTSATTTPRPLAGLAAAGTFAVGYGPDYAQAWTLTGSRLLVDFLLPVSGPWSATRAARELSALLASPAPKTPGSPFARVVLLSSADASLLIQGAALAQAARWLGVRALLPALQAVAPGQASGVLSRGWRLAHTPVALQSAAKGPFDGCGVRLYLVGAHPQVRISWPLSAAGRKLMDEPTAAVAGADLAPNNGLVDRWLKPLAARVPRLLPPPATFAKPGLTQRLTDGGFFMWPLVLAEIWPRLLPIKPVRKAVLKILRTRIRPGRFVRRINVRQHGKVLELVLEGKPPSKGK